MEEQLELFKQWAPDTAMWTQWAKPVVFMNMKNTYAAYQKAFNPAAATWAPYKKERLLIVDLPAEDSVIEGLALAKAGYRPVPLYNGVAGGRKSVVPIEKIVSGLCAGGSVLVEANLNNSANPVFLLDANRMKGAKNSPGTFDNRWCVVPQDMPSANYLKKHGIQEIVVRTSVLQNDLKHILYQYQQQGITIYTSDNKGELQQQKLTAAQKIGLFYRFLLLLGLARNATGGFGMTIPEVSSGGGGYRAG